MDKIKIHISKLALVGMKMNFQEIAQKVSGIGKGAEVERWEVEKDTWMKEAYLLRKKADFVAIVVPGTWLPQTLEDVPGVLLDAIYSGTLRVIFLGTRPEFLFPMPCIFLPKDHEDKNFPVLLRHVTNCVHPGVYSVIPKGNEILIEEPVETKEQLTAHINSAVELFQSRKVPIGGSRLRILAAAMTCLNNALEEAKDLEAQKMKLQVGAQGNLLVFSVRWKVKSSLLEDWFLNPKVPWKQAATMCDSFWLHSIPSDSEVEGVGMFTLLSKDDVQIKPHSCPFPIGVDILTLNRQESLKDCKTITRIEEYQVHTMAKAVEKFKIIVKDEPKIDAGSVALKEATSQSLGTVRLATAEPKKANYGGIKVVDSTAPPKGQSAAVAGVTGIKDPEARWQELRREISRLPDDELIKKIFGVLAKDRTTKTFLEEFSQRYQVALQVIEAGAPANENATTVVPPQFEETLKALEAEKQKTTDLQAKYSRLVKQMSMLVEELKRLRPPEKTG
ncbi:hypothetical protein WDW86_04115 [Bdellovibrionota bacterium FG-2]